MSIIKSLSSSGVVLGLLLIGIGLLAHFVAQYFSRAIDLRRSLRAQTNKVRAIPTRGISPGSLKGELASIFKGSGVEFAWSEYEETLHEQSLTVAGETRVTAIRSTVTAEAFINLDTVVDPKLGAEYFRHLPGILTGLGIIGTFFGLIDGLSGFNPNVAPEELKGGLKLLIDHVRDAFVFSGMAIMSAILVTAIEKWLYASCAKRVGELSQSLDALFRAGIGEEYLSSLVSASEASATQVRQLKEAMVEDLKVLLTNLTEQQISATRQLSTDLGQRIQEGLREPLTMIADTVRKASGQNTEAVGVALEKLMTSFLAQMKETTGTQMTGLSELLQQTATSMTGVEAAVRGLVADMQASGENSRKGVQDVIAELMTKLSAHQSTQDEAVTAVTQRVMAQLEGAITRMTEAQDAADSARRNRDDENNTKFQGHISQVTQVGRETMAAAGEVLGRLGEVSTEAIDGLSKAAGTVTNALSALNMATENLAATAGELATLETRATQSNQQLVQASGQIASAAQALAGATSQLGTVGARLETLSASVGTESEARRELLKSMETFVADARAAGSSFADLSTQVRGALDSGFEQFGTGVSKILSDHLNDYQKQLGNAVSMLAGALEELAEYAGSQAGGDQDD